MDQPISVVSPVTNGTSDVLVSILSSPPAIVSLGAMIVTVILFIVNISVIRRNNAIEFQRKVNLNYYEATVMVAMKAIFESTRVVRKEYYLLRGQFSPSKSADELVQICQSSISKLDEQIENIEANSLLHVAVFSEASGTKLDKIVERFHDDCTQLFSRFGAQTLTNKSIDSLSNQLNQKVASLVKETYSLCRQQNP